MGVSELDTTWLTTCLTTVATDLVNLIPGKKVAELEAGASFVGTLLTALNITLALLLLAFTVLANRRLFLLEERARPQLEADEQYFDFAKITLDDPALYELYLVNDNLKLAWRSQSEGEKKLYIFGEMLYSRLSYIHREYRSNRINKQYWMTISPFLMKMSRSPQFIEVHKKSGRYFEPEFYDLVERLSNLKLVLQPLTLFNFAQALNVGVLIFPSDRSNIFFHYLQTLLPRRFRTIENRSAIERSRYYLAHMNGSPIGVTGSYELTGQPGEVWLGWFGITPRERSTGFGRQLLECTEGVARDNGYSVLRAWTTREPASDLAIKLYERAGYVADETAFCYDGAPITIYSKSLSGEDLSPYAGSLKKAFVGCLDHIKPAPGD